MASWAIPKYFFRTLMLVGLFLETVYRMLLYGLTMTEHVFLWGSSTEKGIGWRPWANIFEVDKSWFVTLHSTE